MMLIMLFTCQPPRMAESTPPPFSQRRPFPSGISHTLVIPTLWVRSVLVSARLRLM